MKDTERNYRAAVIGCGAMGSRWTEEIGGATARNVLPLGHAAVFDRHPSVDLVAGADPDPDRLAAFGDSWGVKNLFSDHVSMLESTKPDLVAVASPPSLHYRHVMDCAQAGVQGIICEKPIATSIAEADEMLGCCAEVGTSLAVNHLLRTDPFVMQARDLIQKNELGEIRSIHALVSGRLFLTGTHMFDLVNYIVGDDIEPLWILGDVERLQEGMTTIPGQRGVDLGGTAMIAYQNGIKGLVNAQTDQLPRFFRLEIFGSDGVIVLDGHDAQLWKPVNRHDELARFPFPQMMEYRSPMSLLLESLLDSMSSGKPPMSSGRMAARALEQIVGTYLSADSQRRMDFPIADKTFRIPFSWS